MSEQSGEPKFLYIKPESVTYTADERQITDGTVRTNMDDDVAREIVADVHGVSPEDVMYGAAKRTGRNNSRASFTNWNSSWVPGAEKANLN